MRLPALVAALLVAAATTSSAPPAAAGEPSPAELQRARELFAESERAERAERWAEALEKLQQVAAIKTTPGILFHMANCEENLGRLAAALEHFEAAERMAIEQDVDDVKALAVTRITPLRQRVPRVTVVVRPRLEGLEVTLDGTPVPLDRLAELRVQPGEEHVIVARAAGRVAVAKRIRLAEGSSAQVDIDLLEPHASSGAAPDPATQPDTPKTSEREGGARPPPTSALIAGGAAVALGAGGLVTFLIAGAHSSSGEEACRNPATCDPTVRDTVRALDRVALALWIGAGLAVGAAVTLWAIDPGDREPAASAGARRGVWLAAAPGSLGVAGRF